MAQAKNPSDVGRRIYDLLNTASAKATLMGTSEASVFYGDQDKLPTTPTVCIETGNTNKPLSGIKQMVTATHTCYVLVYHSKVQDVQDNRYQAEQVGEAIAGFLDANLELKTPNGAGTDPKVIHGHCIDIDPGYAIKDRTLYQAVRITWQGISKYQLGA